MAHARIAALIAALIATACASSSAPPGIYSGAEPLPTGATQQVRVYLKPDGSASMQQSFTDNRSDSFVEGKWQRQADGRIVIDLAAERQERLVFRVSGDQLIAVDWDRARWEKAGPGVLYRVR